MWGEVRKSILIVLKKELITTTNLFKNKLLVVGTDASKFKAKDADAVSFLTNLGFKSGSTTVNYTDADVSAIANLVGKVTSSETGNIEENETTTDFKITAGTCQISIMNKSGDDAQVVKSYTIKTSENNQVGVANGVKQNVRQNYLDLVASKGYVQGGPVLSSLMWKGDKLQNQTAYNAMANFFGKVSLIWTSDARGQTTIFVYPTTGNAYLTIKFGNIKVLAALDCGPLPSPA